MAGWVVWSFVVPEDTGRALVFLAGELESGRSRATAIRPVTQSLLER
jgi:hypothetical protein